MPATDPFDTTLVLPERSRHATFARGLVCYREGRVAPASEQRLRVVATVRGSIPYTVELAVVDGDPVWSCTCPATEDGSFCKHGVAVACLVNDADAAAGVAYKE